MYLFLDSRQLLFTFTGMLGRWTKIRKIVSAIEIMSENYVKKNAVESNKWHWQECVEFYQHFSLPWPYNTKRSVLQFRQKKSAKAYKTFYNLFATPSLKKLMNFLRTIPIGEKINEKMFILLTKSVRKLKENNVYHYYFLMKCSLTLILMWNWQNINRFVDTGDKKTDKFFLLHPSMDDERYYFILFTFSLIIILNLCL